MKNLYYQLTRNPAELLFTSLMFTFWFLVIAIFQLLKPLKTGLFIEHYGAETELYAKLINIALAGAGALLFSWLHFRLNRRWLTWTLSLFFAFQFLLLATLIPRPTPLVIWWFYLLGDFISTIWVTAFWAYLTDIATHDMATRLFGIIGAGGVIGGWVGSATSRIFLLRLGTSGLLVLSAILMIVVALIVWWNEKTWHPVKTRKSRVREGSDWKAALEGIQLVSRSRYLAAIVGILASYEFVSQTLDFIFKRAVETLSGTVTTQMFLANVYLIANIVSLLVQLFIVTYVLRRWKITVGLLILPVSLIVSMFIHLLIPTLMTAALFVILDNGLNYSIQQTSRETLYVPTTPEAKYRARAFANMFIQRFAKGLSISLILLMASLKVSSHVLIAFALGMTLIMVLLSIFSGNEYHELVKSHGVKGELNVIAGV